MQYDDKRRREHRLGFHRRMILAEVVSLQLEASQGSEAVVVRTVDTSSTWFCDEEQVRKMQCLEREAR